MVNFDSPVESVTDLVVVQACSRYRHQLVQALRAIPKAEREGEVAAALENIAVGERRNELKGRFAKLPIEEMERRLGDE